MIDFHPLDASGVLDRLVDLILEGLTWFLVGVILIALTLLSTTRSLRQILLPPSETTNE